MKGENNLSILLQNMQPILQTGEYVFCSLKEEKSLDYAQIVGFFREKEGITIIVRKEYADIQAYTYSATFAWISLSVHSDLESFGLTAAFSQALSQAQISCNVVAGYYHDHIFVPFAKRNEAIEVLNTLARQGNNTY